MSVNTTATLYVGYALTEKQVKSLSVEDFTDEGINIIDALIKAELVTSRGEARRLIEQGGVSVDNEKVTAVSYIIPVSDFEKGYVIIKKGKKVFHKIIK